MLSVRKDPSSNLSLTTIRDILLSITQANALKVAWKKNWGGLMPQPFQNIIYEGWNFNSGNYLFTTDTK